MFTLATLLLPARALTALAIAPNPSPRQVQSIRTQTADCRAAAYKGPRAEPDGKKLGREFLNKSQPATKPVAPAKE